MLGWLAHYGYVALFVLLVLGIVGLPVPDETLLVFSGYLISIKKLHPAFAYLAAAGGSVAGITLSYTIGRSIGYPVIERYGRYLHLTPERLGRVHGWFDRIGEWVLTFGYFIPGVRHFTALVAGTSRLGFRKFALFAYSGAAIWTATFLTLGYVVGAKWKTVAGVIDRYLLEAAAGAAVAIILLWLIRRKIMATKERASSPAAPRCRE